MYIVSIENDNKKGLEFKYFKNKIDAYTFAVLEDIRLSQYSLESVHDMGGEYCKILNNFLNQYKINKLNACLNYFKSCIAEDFRSYTGVSRAKVENNLLPERLRKFLKPEFSEEIAHRVSEIIIKEIIE